MEIAKMPLLTKLTLAAHLVLLGTVGLYVLGSVIMPLLFALILAIMVHPLTVRLERLRIPKAIAIILTLLLTMAVVGGLVAIAVSQIIAFRSALPGLQDRGGFLLNQAVDGVERTFKITRSSQLEELKNHSQELIAYGQAMLANTVSSTVSFLASASLVLLYMFFLLYYRSFFRESIYKLFASQSPYRVNLILQQIYGVIRSYLIGLALVMCIVAVLDTLGLMLVGGSYAVFFAVSAALLMVIPYVGMFSATVIATLVTLVTKDSSAYAIGVFVVMAGVQTLEGNFITPFVVGNKVSVNPFIAIVVLVLGELLWGIGGMILALPMTAIFKVICDAVPQLQSIGYLLGSPDAGQEAGYVARRKEFGLHV